MCHNLTGLFPLDFSTFALTASFVCAFAQIKRGKQKKKTLRMEVVDDVISFGFSPFSGTGDGVGIHVLPIS